MINQFLNKVSIKTLKLGLLLKVNTNSKVKLLPFCTGITMRGGATAKEFKRLPQNVKPTNYALTLKPNFKNFTFIGNESITVQVKEQTNQILLNALELEITNASFKGADGNGNLFNFVNKL